MPRVTAVVLCGLFLSLLTRESPGETPTVDVEIGAGLRPDWPTVFTGRTADLEASVVQLDHPQFVPSTIVAQRDSATGLAWFTAAVSSDAVAGTRISLAARPAPAVPGGVRIEQHEGTWRFLDAGRHVLSYQQQPQSRDGGHTRAGYVHPLLGLDGETLTEVFPDDHRHHHGVFWAWHQLWVGASRAGDPWTTEDFLAVVREVNVVDQGPVFARLQAVVHWTSPRVQDESGASRPIVEERTSIRLFRALPDAQYVDFEIELRSLLEDVRIGGSENERGYSGFTVRVRPPAGLEILDENGLAADDAVGTRSRWADVSGRFGSGDAAAGLAILSHGSLPDFPPRWLLRHYGMQNVAYPGREPVELDRERPLRLRHRLVIHRGNAGPAHIPDHQRQFESLP